MVEVFLGLMIYFSLSENIVFICSVNMGICYVTRFGQWDMSKKDSSERIP